MLNNIPGPLYRAMKGAGFKNRQEMLKTLKALSPLESALVVARTKDGGVWPLPCPNSRDNMAMALLRHGKLKLNFSSEKDAFEFI